MARPVPVHPGGFPKRSFTVLFALFATPARDFNRGGAR